jgi:chaperonin GroEL
MQVNKAKSAAKLVVTRDEGLEGIVLKTMAKISAIVGATLGPNGAPVLVERQEDLLPFCTKDGVSVFKSLGFSHPIAHVVMESARDAAAKTGNSAGDGTTTATVLAEAIVRRSSAFCKKYPSVPPQIVVRVLEKAFKDTIEPTIKQNAYLPKGYEESKKLFHSVACVAGNGDIELADAVMEAVELVGEKGNATISELSGPSGFSVEKIDGFPVAKGLEESAARYFGMFVNDKNAQRCYVEKPLFLLFDGNVFDLNTLFPLLSKVGIEYQADPSKPNNVVVVAHGFSDNVLAQLSFNFVNPDSINIIPLLTPQSMVLNSRSHFLEDLSAFTGARVFDPISRPTATGKITDMGFGMEFVECFRFRSTIVGKPDELLIQDRVNQLRNQKKTAESIYESTLLDERIGILTGGIARIKVFGSSTGELRERRDRTEDAVCAVRGAGEHGVLPGGGWMLLKLASLFFHNGLFGRTPLTTDRQRILLEILVPSLEEPVRKLLSNCGKTDREANRIIRQLYRDTSKVYDAMANQFVEPFGSGILDSTPAVLEAIRNSLSIASLLGTLGGVVVFPRDAAVERQEARDTQDFLRNANMGSEADERI